MIEGSSNVPGVMPSSSTAIDDIIRLAIINEELHVDPRYDLAPPA